MQKYIDQAIFDSGILILGIFGVQELENKKNKFNTQDFIESQDVITMYQNMRPADLLYRPQTIEALDWLITSTPINLTHNNISAIFKTAYDIRKELNSDMQPPSIRERIFRGAAFQPESKNYIDRVAQSKINISKILTEVSTVHHKNYNGLQNLERRLNGGNIKTFINKAVNTISGVLHKNYREDTLLWETQFHFACLVATSCHLSAIKRFENFPNYNSPINSMHATDGIRKSIIEYSRNKISTGLAEQLLEYYISDYISSNNDINDKSERALWENIKLELTSSKWSAEDNDLVDFLSIASGQIDSYDFLHTFDIDFSNLGAEFLNGP